MRNLKILFLRKLMSAFSSHRLHAVHDMWPSATDVARSTICVSICVLGKH